MIRIGVLCPAEIALRRFMPALKKMDGFEFVGVATYSFEERYGLNAERTQERQSRLERSREKAQEFIDLYGGTLYESYQAICTDETIDALYIPVPPAAHFMWTKLALESGKHVFLEKPSTTSLSDTKALAELAKAKNLALHENYMFVFHKQLNEINRIIEEGTIGEVRLYRLAFGFPRRAAGDFRYQKAAGGGAIYDCGGYTLKYADYLLKGKGRIAYASSVLDKETDVEILGTAAMVDDAGVTVQMAFGMDNEYKCELEVWGSKGTLKHERIFTAPAGFVPCCSIKKGAEQETIELPEDDTFFKSLKYFGKCIADMEERKTSYRNILRQAELVEETIKFSK